MDVIIFTFVYNHNISKTKCLQSSSTLFGKKIQIRYIISESSDSSCIDHVSGMRFALDSLPNHAIVCFIDAYHVLLNDSVEILLEKFLKFECDLVFCAALSCNPESLKNRFMINCNNNSDFSNDNSANIQSQYHFLNSGGYIGYKYAVMRCLYWKPDSVISKMCLQTYFNEFYLAHCDNETKQTFSVRLDHPCKIFQNMYLVDWSDIRFRNGHMENTGLMERPVFIYFPTGDNDDKSIFLKKMEGSRISPLPLTLSEYTQHLTRDSFPVFQTKRVQRHRLSDVSFQNNSNNVQTLNRNIGGIFYINLDRREDRLAHIQQELLNYGLLDKGMPHVERFTAIDRPEPGKGIVGCTCSHLAVFKEAKRRNYSSVLIFEDDFTFCVSKEDFFKNLCLLFELEVDFQVCMLAYKLEDSREVHEYSFLRKVLDATSASAYIVHESLYDRLIALYEWTIPLLEETGEHWLYANDQVWKVLQRDSSVNWYAFTQRIGRQLDGYSDNSETYMKYDC